MKTKIKKNQIIMLVIIMLTLFVGIFIGRHSEQSTVSEKKPMYWVDTMEPTIHYQSPGMSRMGMELTPVYPDVKQATDQNTVRISPALVNNLGVRIEPVKSGNFAKRIEAIGYIAPNENKISHIHTYADGWVKTLYVKAVGEMVKSDQVVMQLYSPTLVNAQEEYLLALGSEDQSLIDASIKKMQALHISDQQIQQLKTTKKSSQLIDIYPHQDGVVTMLNIREGMHVTPDTEMMSLVDLSSIWMIAELYEDQANSVKVGDAAEARLSAFPGKTWDGAVEYIYPQLDPTTHSLKVRFRFANPDGTLKPNMYANVFILSEPKLNILSIPLEALIRSSEGNRVIVSLGDGRFEARSVTVGMESGDRVEILSGLKAGEQVVSSGQFLIDSETNLKTGLDRLDAVQNTEASQQPSLEPNKMIEGKGVIKVLNIPQHSVTLVHEPIPALNWPVMTMDFSVNEYTDLEDFKVGDHVKFVIKSAKENQFITEIEKSPN